MPKVKPRKLPRIRWTNPADLPKYEPAPPPDMADFPVGGLCITIDEGLFRDFIADLERQEEENAGVERSCGG
jgi:hypothetical protein